MIATSTPLAFTPGLAASDPLANYWLAQATLRLRREICWLWQERGPAREGGLHPPLTDRASESLDRARFFEEKLRFWETDVTARYLTQRIAEPEPDFGTSPRGSFSWVVSTLELDPVSRLALGLALLSVIDSAAGGAIAACLNDANRSTLTLSLLQKLWDRPEEVLPLADSTHPLFRLGLLRKADGYPCWDTPLTVPEILARRLLYPDAPRPSQLRSLQGLGTFAILEEAAQRLALRLAGVHEQLRVAPLNAPSGSSPDQFLQAVSRLTRRSVVRLDGPAAPTSISAALSWCWMAGCDLYVGAIQGRWADALTVAYGIPVTLFVDAPDHGSIEGIPKRNQLSGTDIPPLPFADRLETWREALGPTISEQHIAEIARRFRYEADAITEIASALQRSESPVTYGRITAVCRSARPTDLGELAQKVIPRFDSAKQLILPERQREHFAEVLTAMRFLTEVHYRWGTARVWNEGGIPVLFAGPPGTGKTMAAEILASELDLPMYRVDLSQVVNKYIGETEKNLKRIFDAADMVDVVLLFDEADSIFGKRMEARDAHDRYANLEISYLLERMERFKGLAVLATNRKKDLDEAFLRRLRYIVDFPLPGPAERRLIWKNSIPAGVDASALNLDLLATRFAISGGHIRSVIFNACLQSGDGGAPTLRMDAVVIALKRELDKMSRPVALDLFGEYAAVVKRIEHENDNPS